MYRHLAVSMLLMGMGIAAPTEMPHGECPGLTTKYTANAGPVYWDPPVLDTAAGTCGSTTDTTCTIGKTESVTNGIIITEGGSISLDIPEIGSLAFSPSISYTYSHTTGTSDGVICPSGTPFYTCGMTSTSPFQDISGVKTTCGGGSYPDCSACQNQQYKIKVPAQHGNIPRWDPCISSHSKNQTTTSGLQMCPN